MDIAPQHETPTCKRQLNFASMLVHGLLIFFLLYYILKDLSYAIKFVTCRGQNCIPNTGRDIPDYVIDLY